MYVLDDSKLEDVVFSPVCSHCVHLDSTRENRRRCDAYPDGIPAAIWDGKNDHARPFPGDNGIRFERGTPKFLRDRAKAQK